MIIKPQAEFPLLERYKQFFPITEKEIFAYNGVVYTNYQLPDHLIVHEKVHLDQQERDGLEFWVENYLNNDEYRLKQEIEAYRTEVRSIRDRNFRNMIRIRSAKNLSSELYGNIIKYEEALQILK